MNPSVSDEVKCESRTSERWLKWCDPWMAANGSSLKEGSDSAGKPLEIGSEWCVFLNWSAVSVEQL
jgi:hypothetical protein